jgi:hypothetical protein
VEFEDFASNAMVAGAVKKIYRANREEEFLVISSSSAFPLAINSRFLTSNPTSVVPVNRALDNFSTEDYVTSSVLGQGVFDSPSLTLVIGANIF